MVSSKICDKRGGFDFWVVGFPFLDGDVPRSPSYGVYISQLIRFARECSSVDEFNKRNLFSTARLLKQGCGCHRIRRAFSKFYHRHSELIVKYNIGLKTLLQQGMSEPIFYSDLVLWIQKSCWRTQFGGQFGEVIKRYIEVGYGLDVKRLSVCLGLDPNAVCGYGFLFGCPTVGRASGSMAALACGFDPWVDAWCLSVSGPAVAWLGVSLALTVCES